MKKVLSILTLLILIFTGQEIAFNIDNEEMIQPCNLNGEEKSLSYDNKLKQFELGKIPLESLDITARTKPAFDNYERLFKLSNSNKSLLLLKLKEQASQYKISETLSNPYNKLPLASQMRKSMDLRFAKTHYLILL